MEVPDGWTSRNKPGDESLVWQIETRKNAIHVGVSIYARGADGYGDSFYVSVGTSKATVHITSGVWKWSSPVNFYLSKAGLHTLKVQLREDGAKVAKVRLTPKTTMNDRMPVWFAQTDSESFTSGILSHDESGKCMVRILISIY